MDGPTGYPTPVSTPTAATSPTLRTVKYVVLVPDGCADEPVEVLGGQTPLEAADLPNLQALAARSEVGRATVIPGGLPPGSDVGNLAILGYDPEVFHTGRAPIEAAAMGVELAPGEVAYRCNLVTHRADGTMVDFAAGHLSSEQSHPIIAALDAALGDGRDGVRFHPASSTATSCVVPGDWADAECVPPHDLTGKPGGLADRAGGAASSQALMDASRAGRRGGRGRRGVDRDPDLVVGSGHAGRSCPTSPTASASRVGSPRRSTSCAGSASSRASRSSMCPARPPDSTTTTSPSASRASTRSVIATFSCSTWRPPTRPATSRTPPRRSPRSRPGTGRSSGRSSMRCRRSGPLRILLLPDHATPVELGTHTSEPVPYLLHDRESAW